MLALGDGRPATEFLQYPGGPGTPPPPNWSVVGETCCIRPPKLDLGQFVVFLTNHVHRGPRNSTDEWLSSFFLSYGLIDENESEPAVVFEDLYFRQKSDEAFAKEGVAMTHTYPAAYSNL
jgi:hypothetical protein